MANNKLLIYLAGCEKWYYEHGSNYFEEWRKEVEEWFRKYTDDVVVINPCNYYSFGEKHHKSDAEIRKFDLHKVRCSDVVLVNLDHMTDSVGSMNEVFIADELNIPVVGFYEFNGDDDKFHNDNYKKESWILDAILRIEDDETTSMIDACNYIKNYFVN